MDAKALAYFAAGTAAALPIRGGAAGIGKLAAAAMEGIARQPNAAGDIRGAMILSAALIEGVTFFSLIVTILLAIKAWSCTSSSFSPKVRRRVASPIPT